MLMTEWKQANERPDAFVDHSGVLRDSRTGKPIEDIISDNDEEPDDQLSEFWDFWPSCKQTELMVITFE